MNYDGEPRPSGMYYRYLKEERARKPNASIFPLEKRETIKTVPGKPFGGRKSKKLSRKNKRKTLRKKRNP